MKFRAIPFTFRAILLLSLVGCLFVFKARLSPVMALPSIFHQVTISAAIGEPKLRLFGYGPVEAKVQLHGQGVSDTTTADNKGYFEFTAVFLPVYRPAPDREFQYPELCLTAVDGAGLTTPPTCIPPLPLEERRFDVGPVILSPTFKIQKGASYKGDAAAASGITTPNSPVEVYLAEGNENYFDFSLVSSAFAYYVPTYHITSNEAGYFEFNLPTDNPNSWRIFVASRFENAPSPKSNTLSHRVYPFWYLILDFLLGLLRALRPYWYLLFVLLQATIIIGLYRKFQTIKRTEE